MTNNLNDAFNEVMDANGTVPEGQANDRQVFD